MILALLFSAAGLVGPVIAIVLGEKGTLTRPAAIVLGVLSGPVCVAGILIGAVHQPTTANIHSGYSFRGVLEWILLAAAGGVLGLGFGLVFGVAWHRRTAGRFAFAALALAAALGWVISSQRDVIDCDDEPAFCDNRYD